MNAIDVAAELGVSEERARAYLLTCKDVVESDQYVAILQGNTVHIAVKVSGLGGRKLLRDCRDTLSRWFETDSVLLAGVRYGNEKAIRLAEALGFKRYGATDTHVWLMQTKEQFHAA